MSKIYSKIFFKALKNLSSYERQKNSWFRNQEGNMSSFTEDVINLYDDALVSEAIENGQIIYSQQVNNALLGLEKTTNMVDEFQPEADIINDPAMQVVREKAAEVLALIEASDGSESTVEIVE